MTVNGATGEVQDTMNIAAAADAMNDIAAESQDEGTVPAYVGAAIIECEMTGTMFLENIFIPKPHSYAEAVGLAYIHCNDKFTEADGYRMLRLKMEERIVYIDAEVEPDETDNVILNMANPWMNNNSLEDDN